MIKKILWNEIEDIWKNYLWINRMSPIESNSAMNFLSEHSSYNMTTTPTFFGYFENNTLAGVNSGHMCENYQYRSRGLYVFENYRGKGIGVQLLLTTISQAKKENSKLIWSLPRKTSWKTYQRAGFTLSSPWFQTETSDQNAYCCIEF